MNWVRTYAEFIHESLAVYESTHDSGIAELEKILKLPADSGVFQSVVYDKAEKCLIIEQPTNLSSMDSGAILSAINQNKPGIKKAYSGIQHAMIDNNMQIKI